MRLQLRFHVSKKGDHSQLQNTALLAVAKETKEIAVTAKEVIQDLGLTQRFNSIVDGLKWP